MLFVGITLVLVGLLGTASLILGFIILGLAGFEINNAHVKAATSAGLVSIAAGLIILCIKGLVFGIKMAGAWGG